MRGWCWLLLCLSVAVGVTLAEDLTIHIIPHSHCDPGWLYPVNTYYERHVKFILNTVYKSLLENKKRKFVWSETFAHRIQLLIPKKSRKNFSNFYQKSVFFKIWWEQQSQEIQENVKKMVLDEKRLEFVGGGWVQSDEALTTFESVIKQTTVGHKFLKDNLGVVPEVSWQIDPFGHSKVFPKLQYEMGFKYGIINRVDERLKKRYPEVPESGQFSQEKKLQFFQEFENGSGKILYNILFNHYNSYKGCANDICFDNDMNSYVYPDSSVAYMATQFLEYAKELGSLYRTPNALILLGDDILYEQPTLFQNMDRIIAHFESDPSKYQGIKSIRYSTASEYFKSIESFLSNHTTIAKDFPVRKWEDPDFMPYSDCHTGAISSRGSCAFFWTGFYGSRPELKKEIRKTERILGISEFLHNFAKIKLEFLKNFKEYFPKENADRFETDISKIENDFLVKSEKMLQNLREQASLMGHHDAITGTQKKITYLDYLLRMKDAKTKISAINNNLVAFILYKFQNFAELSKKTTNSQKYVPFSQIQDNLMFLEAGKNTPNLEMRTNTKFLPLIVWNSLPSPKKEMVNMLVSTPDIRIVKLIEKEGLTKAPEVKFEIFEVPRQIPRQNKENRYRLVFPIEIDGYSAQIFFIELLDSSKSSNNIIKTESNVEFLKKQNEISIENNIFKLNFKFSSQKDQFLLESFSNLAKSQQFDLSLQIMKYISDGDGAYWFRPSGDATFVPISTNSNQNPTTISRTQGKLYSEIFQQWNENIWIIYQTFENDPSIHLEIGHANNGINDELIFRVSSQNFKQISSKNEEKNPTIIYTDVNNYEIVKRTYQFQEPNKPNQISSNFFPITTNCFLQFENGQKNEISRLSLFSKSPTGVSSQNHGELEVFLNRNSGTDDGRGMDENIYYNELVNSKFLLQIGTNEDFEQIRRKTVQNFNNPLKIWISEHVESPQTFTNMFFGTVSLLNDKTVKDSDLDIFDFHASSSKSKFVMKLFNRNEKEKKYMKLEEFFDRKMNIRAISLQTPSETKTLPRNSNNLPKNTLEIQPRELKAFEIEFVPRMTLFDYKDYHFGPNEKEDSTPTQNSNFLLPVLEFFENLRKRASTSSILVILAILLALCFSICSLLFLTISLYCGKKLLFSNSTSRPQKYEAVSTNPNNMDETVFEIDLDDHLDSFPPNEFEKRNEAFEIEEEIEMKMLTQQK